MNDPRIDEIFILQTIFGAVHLIYFIIYYGRYSTLNQKLNGIEKMEKAAVVDQSVIDASRLSINGKITQIRKWSYLPIIPIAVIHVLWLLSSLPENPTTYNFQNGLFIPEEVPLDFTTEYLTFGFITLGSFLLIMAGNFVKGAQIFDPNKRFGRYSPWK